MVTEATPFPVERSRPTCVATAFTANTVENHNSPGRATS